MPVVTSIKPQKNQKRFNVYLDGRFGFAVSAEALAKAELKVDQEISKEDIKRLKYQDTKSKLYDRTLNFLTYRPRSEKEIRDYLKNKVCKLKIENWKFRESKPDLQSKIVNQVIKVLKKRGLIDDHTFAAWWVEQRSSFRPKGRQLLYLELLKKGVEKEIIESSLLSGKEELDLAKKAAQKKLKTYQNLEPLEFRQKMAAFLARRGFNWETIKKVLEEMKKKS